MSNPVEPPQTHQIVIAETPGGPDVLRVETRELAPPGPGEVIIRAAACGVNRPDTIERMGFYPPPEGAPEGLGLEASGVIAAIGEGVERWSIGDEVCALVAGGGYSDYVRAPAGSVLPRPESVSLEEAAGLPETVFTVWANVFEAGALKPGETLLVHGGAGGIGVTAIQMAAAHGARVFATAGGPDKARLCEQLGAERGIDYRSEDFEAIVSAAGGADVVLDMIGGDYVQKNLNTLRAGGRHVSIAFLNGSRVEIDLMRVMLKRLVLTGSTLRARPDDEKARLAAAIEKSVWPWIAAGQVRPVIDEIVPLTDPAAAHARMEGRGHRGKILLKP